MTCGGADWLRAAGTAAASELRRGAASARAQCLRRGAALPLPGVRLRSVARGSSPPPCSLGRCGGPQREEGGRTRSGGRRTPGRGAADARLPPAAAQPVVLRRVPALARPVEPAVGLLPPSPARPRTLRLQGLAVRARTGQRGALRRLGLTHLESPAALIALGNFALCLDLCLPWGSWTAVRQAPSLAGTTYWGPWSSRRRPSPSSPPGPTPSPSPRSCPAAAPRRSRPRRTPSNPWVSRPARPSAPLSPGCGRLARQLLTLRPEAIRREWEVIFLLGQSFLWERHSLLNITGFASCICASHFP